MSLDSGQAPQGGDRDRRMDRIMREFTISLNDLPEEGRSFSFADDLFFAERFEAYGPAARIVSPLSAELMVIPEDEGVLIRGELCGELALSCDRCAEEATVAVNAHFDEFEAFPPEPSRPEARGGRKGKAASAPKHGEDEAAEVGLTTRRGKALLLDAGALLWEHLLLALPVKPLCREACKGVCPECGANLNEAGCACAPEKSDPRLTALKGLKVQPKA